MKNILVLLLFGVALSTADLDDIWRPARTAKKFREGAPTFIYTHGNNHWNQAWYTVQDRHEFVFSVKACSSVKLALSSFIGLTDESVEIVLGDESNTKSVIRYPFETGSLFEAYTPDLLDCNDYRTFWVAWHIDYIEVGRGPSITEQKFLNWFDKSLHTINAIGISSGENTAATWEIKGNTGDLLELTTPAEYMYSTMWKYVGDRDFYHFRVRACGDVHVLMSEELGRQENNIYEISIGGWNNNKTVIRTSVYGGGETVKAERQEYGVVSCEEFSELWVSWYNNTISVGRGDIYGSHRLLHWNSDLSVDVRYLSFTTGFGNTGSWIFDDDEETFTMLHTPKSNTTTPADIYNTSWIEMPKERFFQFWVKSEKEARILLADDNNVLDEEFDVQIIIGGENDKKICVGYMFEPGCLKEYEGSAALLSSMHFKPFWISWFNHSLHIGKGYFYGERPLIKDVQINQDFAINAIALATTMSTGRFKFREYMGERVDYRTPNYYTSFQDVCSWRTVYTKSWFIFYFAGESDAHITLSPTYGINHESSYYDVIVSGWGGTRSVIMEFSDYGKIGKEISEAVDTTGLLANGDQELWISWFNGLVEVGKGSIVGEERFLHHLFEDGLDVRALSVQTGWGYKGRWWMYENLGDYSTFYTNGTKNPNNWLADQYIVMDAFLRFITFWVKSCTEATVLIGSRQAQDRYDHFKVVFGADDNTKIKLYHEAQDVKSADQSPAVECHNNRQYWISWHNKKIEVGQGYRYGFSKYFEYEQDANYNLTYVGFTSLPHQETMGRFHLQHAYGPDFEMYTNTDYAYLNWFTIEHKDYIIFSVRACSDVHILLSERLKQHWGYSYEIVIGGWENTRSVIREWIEDEHGQRMPEYVIKETPGILNCSAFQTFWIAWHDGVIMVGSGIFFDGYRNAWIDYHPVNPRVLRALSFSTGYSYDGYWLIDLLPDVAAPPVSEMPSTSIPSEETVSSMSGGAIFGIVIAVFAVLALFGMVAYLVLMSRGYAKTPTFLQAPAEGSGFENPTAEKVT